MHRIVLTSLEIANIKQFWGNPMKLSNLSKHKSLKMFMIKLKLCLSIDRVTSQQEMVSIKKSNPRGTPNYLTTGSLEL